MGVCGWEGERERVREEEGKGGRRLPACVAFSEEEKKKRNNNRKKSQRLRREAKKWSAGEEREKICL